MIDSVGTVKFQGAPNNFIIFKHLQCIIIRGQFYGREI